MSDDEFSSWFNHDGGPCPLQIGTVVIREVIKPIPGKGVILRDPRIKLLREDDSVFMALSPVTDTSFSSPNSWEWKYFNTRFPSGNKVCKIVRYRVKKSPSVKLLEKLVSDPPSELIEDRPVKELQHGD